MGENALSFLTHLFVVFTLCGVPTAIASQPEVEGQIIKAGLIASVVIIEGVDFLKDSDVNFLQNSKSRSDRAAAISAFMAKLEI